MKATNIAITMLAIWVGSVASCLIEKEGGVHGQKEIVDKYCNRVKVVTSHLIGNLRIL